MKYGIRRIINITKEVTNSQNGIQYLHVPIDDSNTCQKDLNSLFDKATDFIYDSLKSKEPILVHCKMGHHRSASVVVAFMIRYLDIDYITASTYINSIRKCALVRQTCMVDGLFNYYINLIHSRYGKQCSCDICKC